MTLLYHGGGGSTPTGELSDFERKEDSNSWINYYENFIGNEFVLLNTYCKKLKVSWKDNGKGKRLVK